MSSRRQARAERARSLAAPTEQPSAQQASAPSQEDRQKGFVQGMARLEQQFGFTVGAQVTTEQLGHAVLTKPQIAVLPIEGWQPPQENVKIPPETAPHTD